MTDSTVSGENGSRQHLVFGEVLPDPVLPNSNPLPDVSVTCASPPALSPPPPEGGGTSPSLLTQIDSMLDEKFPELHRGRPSKLIKERAEAMARNREPSPVEQRDLSQVMVSVAARAAALAEKRDDSNGQEEAKKSTPQQHTLPTIDRMAATVLNLAEPIAPITVAATDSPDGGTQPAAHRPETSSTSERMKALLDSFQHSASLQDTVKHGTSPNRPRSRTVDSFVSPLTSCRLMSVTMSPAAAGQMSQFFSRSSTHGLRASLQTRIRRREKDSKDGAGHKQENSRKHERKDSVKVSRPLPL